MRGLGKGGELCEYGGWVVDGFEEGGGGECFVIARCERKSNDDGVGIVVRFNSKVKSCGIPLLSLRRIVNEPMKESTRKA